MYAAPSKASAATKITRDANYPPATKPSKIVQYYKRDKPRNSMGGTANATSLEEESDSTPWSTSRLFAHARASANAEAEERAQATAGSVVAAHQRQQQQEEGEEQAAVEGGGSGGGGGGETEHPLRFGWTFWFMHRAPGQKIDDYEAAMIKIASFATVEGFWAVYSHLKRPDRVPTITDYHMFRQGVRPVWEDPANVNGGKWMVRLRKGLSPRMWEKLAMAVVGDAFCVGDEICGIVLSIRNSEDIISLWNRTALDTKTNALIRDTMKAAMGLPPECVVEYKAHNDSLKDNSSFRNTDVYK
ncbi:hypothetical protein LPJ75_003412 [Coemansia sp. RSA 2598]|nr:hypothetical protein LPJ75_003412 [Coemansia sp. RSA 2598]